MSGSISEDLVKPAQTALESWLKSLGFSRGNPFANVEADQERVVLPEFFVDVDGYEQIKGNKSIIVFAPRGGGKSALKVVLASYAAPIQIKSTTLAVEFTDFDGLITKQQSEQKLTIDDYVTHLLRASTKTLWELVCGFPTDKATDRHRIRAERVGDISIPVRVHLAQITRLYCPILLTPRELYKYFESLHPEQSVDWQVFLDSANNRCLRTQILGHLPNVNPVIELLADLNDAYNIAPDPLETPVNKISELLHICKGIGIQVVHFLIDRLDEHMQTADDPSAQVAILEPLLAHLPILEMPNVAFKFFLTRKTRDILLSRSTIRRDRLTDQAVTVKWEKHHLKNLLDLRLEVYSEGAVHDLPSLFVKDYATARVEHSSKSSDFDIGKEIEAEMLQLAQGSPRRLLLAAQLLFQVHAHRVGTTGLLEQTDWEIAKTELMGKMPPLLYLKRTTSVAWVGDHEIRLTSREFAILLALVEHGGKCDRGELIQAAWETDKGVSDQAIDQAISRLREKLGDNSDLGIYLITERGKGFSLRNYDLE